MVEIVGSRASKIELSNNLIATGEIEIETKHSFIVNYAEDGLHCRATLLIGIQKRGQPETLNILCEVVGDFNTSKIETEDDKKKAHIDCYHLLFPYAQSLLARLCTEAGLAPFFFPQITMKEDTVNILK